MNRINPLLVMPCVGRTMLVLICGLGLTVSTASRVALAQNPVPLINQPLIPDAVQPGGQGFTLTVKGTGFVPGAVVHWNGSPRVTTFVGASQVKANILSTDIAKASTASITVINPSPGGGKSNPASFEVTIPGTTVALIPSEFGQEDTPTSIAAADFNGDGKLDLALANINGNNVSVYLAKAMEHSSPPSTMH